MSYCYASLLARPLARTAQPAAQVHFCLRPSPFVPFFHSLSLPASLPARPSARPPSAEESGRLAADAATEDDGDGLLATVGVRASVV